MIWRDGGASVGSTKAFIRFDKKIHFYEKTENGCVEITEVVFMKGSIKNMSKTLREQRQTLISYLLQMNMEEDEILNMIPFIDSQVMIQEMITALKEKDFRMDNQEIWNAAGRIVKRHLK